MPITLQPSTSCSAVLLGLVAFEPQPGLHNYSDHGIGELAPYHGMLKHI